MKPNGMGSGARLQAVGDIMPQAKRLAGKTVLVIGGGQTVEWHGDESPIIGNGRAVCIMAAREGAHVIVVDRDPKSAGITCNMIETEGGSAEYLCSDISNANSVEAEMASVIKDHTHIDGLVLNVGVGAGTGLAESPADLWDQVFAINVRGQMQVCRALLPGMTSGGSVVFISSIAAKRPVSGYPAYDASKAALHALSRTVALEGLDRHVRSNVVMLGFLDTPLGRVASTFRPEREERTLPFDRQGTAWEAAHPVVFLLSQQASYINAQVLQVDGGYLSLF